MADRPIKFNPSGKYNLNFIDQQNQWENVIEADYDGESVPEKSPIYGMSPENFHALMLEDSVSFRLEQENLQKQVLGMGFKLDAIKKMKAEKTDQDCSICLKTFIKGEIIRLLKCNHIFHDDCILPWFQKRSVCPNCRTDQKVKL